MVAHLTGGQGVAGSNPVSPTEGPFAKILAKRPGWNKKKSLLRILRSDFWILGFVRMVLHAIREFWARSNRFCGFSSASPGSPKVCFLASFGVDSRPDQPLVTGAGGESEFARGDAHFPKSVKGREKQRLFLECIDPCSSSFVGSESFIATPRIDGCCDDRENPRSWKVIKLDDWAEIRHLHSTGKHSKREIARLVGVRPMGTV